MLEMLMDPLGALVVTFFVMSIISIAGIALLFLSRNEKMKKGLIYILSVWGVIVAYCGVLSTGGFAFSDGIFSMVFGAIGVAALIIQLFSKKENKFQLARILVTISIVAGMIDCFMI